MDLKALVEAWKQDESFEGDLVHLKEQPARPAIYADLDPPLKPLLQQRLAERGIDRLYRHQVEAIESVRSGAHTVISSGTASGKTLVYQVPVVEQLIEDRKATALLVFPTKALAQDQLRSLTQLRIPELSAATFDGDTDRRDRSWIRRHANVVLTNPDMLHVGILPNHVRWADFLLRLRFVVIDEMHVLRGIFGSHVSHVLRRLRRLAGHYRSQPTFIFGSATIGNPKELAERLSGLEVTSVTTDHSAEGERLTALWNPPLDPDWPDRRKSSLTETTDLFVDLVENDCHTIAFTRSRKSTELIYRWAADRLEPPLDSAIAPYRGGYLAQDRRTIERRLFEGELRGVITTNALELGIDVGSLDAAVLNTFPGTIASFRQQSGRAGRTNRSSLAVLVGGEDALDQYFMTHPSELFDRPPEPVVINPENPLLSAAHAGCAAYEKPLDVADREILGSNLEEVGNLLVQEGSLSPRQGLLHWSRQERPAPQIDIRTSGGPAYRIVTRHNGELLGTVEQQRAFTQAHPGAVYLHLGDSYLVKEMDHRNLRIEVERADVGYYTMPKTVKSLDILEVRDHKQVGSLPYYWGTVLAESSVVGFQRRRVGSREVLSFEPLDLPSVRFESQGFWYTVDEELISGPVAADLLGTLHAAEHTAIAMLPVIAICDRWDLGGLSTNYHEHTGRPTVFIYEGYPGGAGISPVAYDRARGHLETTLGALQRCPCASGCPSCVQSPKCGNFNDPLSKAGAAALLRTALMES